MESEQNKPPQNHVVKESVDVDSGWKSQLNVIGVFIGTHGLAVFLVVFYTIFLYPQSEKERKEWIEQITRIRELIEPETRSLTQYQAEVVLSIAKRSFLQDLENKISEDYYKSQLNEKKLISAYFDDGKLNILYFSGEQYKFSENSDDKEFIKLLVKYNEAYTLALNQSVRRVMVQYDSSLSNSEVIKYQLGRLTVDKKNLDEVWSRVINPLRVEWEKNISDDPYKLLGSDIQVVKIFFQNHPSYDKILQEKPELFKYILPPLPKNEQTPINKLSLLIDQNISKELKIVVKPIGDE